MKQSTIITGVVIAAAALAALVFGLHYTSDRQILAEVKNYEDCRKAGFQVEGTSSETCATPDGRTFTRIVETHHSTTTPFTATTTVPSNLNSYKDQIVITSPKAREAISSPLVITGKARGSWYFEGSFAVKLIDSKNRELAYEDAYAKGEWTTDEYVPFTVTLNFTHPGPTIAEGTLVFIKDNPSGLPQNDDQFKMPIRFVRINEGTHASGSSTAAAACFVGGCSGQICSDQKDAVSTCEYSELYACYKQSFARCERQANGQCGWTETPELASCLTGGGPR